MGIAAGVGIGGISVRIGIGRYRGIGGCVGGYRWVYRWVWHRGYLIHSLDTLGRNDLQVCGYYLKDI